MKNNNNEVNTAEPKLDCEGFLNDIEFWSMDLAEKLATDNDIAAYGLTEAHWEVIKYIRDYYEKYGRGPEIVKVAKKANLSMTEFCQLFPCGFVKGAYKVAGLPRPAGCI